MATKTEFLKMIAEFDDTHIVVCVDDCGNHGSANDVVSDGKLIAIKFGGSETKLTKLELVEKLEPFHEDTGVICMRENGGWDNVEYINTLNDKVFIHFGGGSPFSSER